MVLQITIANTTESCWNTIEWSNGTEWYSMVFNGIWMVYFCKGNGASIWSSWNLSVFSRTCLTSQRSRHLCRFNSWTMIAASWLIHSQSLQNHQPPLPLPRGPRSVRGYSHGTLLVHYWFQAASASNNTVRKTYWKLSVRKTRHLRKCARTRCGNLMWWRPWHHTVASRWLR